VKKIVLAVLLVFIVACAPIATQAGTPKEPVSQKSRRVSLTRLHSVLIVKWRGTDHLR